jgi:quinol-cytochrome oxidoreductase complex cytochrome b subunit
VHVILLPWLLLGLVGLHFGIIRKLGVAPLAYGTGAGREIVFYPHHLMRIVGTVAVTLATLVTLVVLFPRDFGPPADPAVPPDAMPASWIAVLPWRGLAFYLGAVGPVLLFLLGLALLVLPLVDDSAERDLRRRPMAIAIAVIGVGGLLVASGVGYALRSRPPARVQPAVEETATPFGGADSPALPAAPDSTEGGER